MGFCEGPSKSICWIALQLQPQNREPVFINASDVSLVEGNFERHEVYFATVGRPMFDLGSISTPAFAEKVREYS
jgi:hypothetical protein